MVGGGILDMGTARTETSRVSAVFPLLDLLFMIL